MLRLSNHSVQCTCYMDTIRFTGKSITIIAIIFDGQMKICIVYIYIQIHIYNNKKKITISEAAKNMRSKRMCALVIHAFDVAGVESLLRLLQHAHRIHSSTLWGGRICFENRNDGTRTRAYSRLRHFTTYRWRWNCVGYPKRRNRETNNEQTMN